MEYCDSLGYSLGGEQLDSSSLEHHGGSAFLFLEDSEAELMHTWFSRHNIVKRFKRSDDTIGGFVMRGDFNAVFFNFCFTTYALRQELFTDLLLRPASAYKLFTLLRNVPFDKTGGVTSPRIFIEAAVAAIMNDPHLRLAFTLDVSDFAQVGIARLAHSHTDVFYSLRMNSLVNAQGRLVPAASLEYLHLAGSAEASWTVSIALQQRGEITEEMTLAGLFRTRGDGARDEFRWASAFARVTLPMPLSRWHLIQEARINAFSDQCLFAVKREEYEPILLRAALCDDPSALYWYPRVQRAVAGAAGEADIISYIEALMRTANLTTKWKLSELFALEAALESLDQFLSLPSTSAISVGERISVITTRLRETMTDASRPAQSSSTAGTSTGDVGGNLLHNIYVSAPPLALCTYIRTHIYMNRGTLAHLYRKVIRLSNLA